MSEEVETGVSSTGIQPVVVGGAELPPIGVTMAEAMALLRVGRKTLERIIDRGEVVIFTIGASEATGGLRVNYQSLQDYAKARQVDPLKRHSRR